MTPQDPLGPARPMPLPKIQVGMQIEPFKLSRWQRRQILRDQIREHNRVARRLRAKGYLAQTPDDPTILGNHAKGMIRSYLKVIDTAYLVEIAGVHGQGFHLGAMPMNECYVAGVRGAASGMTYYGQLLWRARIDGNNVVVLQTPQTVSHTFSEHELLERESKAP